MTVTTMDPAAADIETVNAARLVVMGLLGLLAGLAVLIMLRYAALIHRGYKGILPVHVFAVSVSYLLLCYYAGRSLWEYYMRDASATWRIFVAAPAALIGLFALLTVLSHLWSTSRRMDGQKYCPECGRDLAPPPPSK